MAAFAPVVSKPLLRKQLEGTGARRGSFQFNPARFRPLVLRGPFCRARDTLARGGFLSCRFERRHIVGDHPLDAGQRSLTALHRCRCS